MCDIFMPEEFGDMFRNQHIVILGGSQMRGLYRDMVWLLNHPSIIPNELLGGKLESRFPDMEKTEWKDKKPDEELYKIFHKDNRDYLLDSRGLTSGRTYIEPRWYHNKKYKVTILYIFTVQVFQKELEDTLLNYEKNYGAPISTIIMNSTLWDVNRFGPQCKFEYKKNIQKLLKVVREVLPKEDGSFIFLTCPLVSEETQSRGMNVPGLEFQCFFTRYNVVEANAIAAHEVTRAGYGVLDLHYFFQLQQFRRKRDGIHWDIMANRMITNLILTYIQLWRRGDGEENGLTGRIGNDDDQKEPSKPWEEQNFALEVAKLKAKKIKEGPKSEEEVREALEELEANLDPTKGRTAISKDLREILDRKAVAQKNAERANSKRKEWFDLYPLPNQNNQMVNRFHPYQRPDAPVNPVNPMPQMNPGAPCIAPTASRFDEDPDMLDMDFRGPEERMRVNDGIWNNRMGGQEMVGPINDGGMNRNPPRGYDLDSFDNPPAAGGSGEPNLSPAEYQMLNQLLRTRISNYYTKWGQEPSQEWKDMAKEEVIKSILDPMGGMQGGGSGGNDRSFMMGAAAFNDVNPGDYNYTDFSGGPMRRPRNMMPGNSMQQNPMTMSGFGNFNNPAWNNSNFGGMNNMGGNDMFMNQGNMGGMNGAVNRMMWKPGGGPGFGRGGGMSGRGFGW